MSNRLWIKNQDGINLRMVENVRVVRVKDENDEPEWIIVDVDQFILGSYDSKERALEIINEIEKVIVNMGIVYYEYLNYREPPVLEYSYASTTLYRMPKE